MRQYQYEPPPRNIYAEDLTTYAMTVATFAGQRRDNPELGTYIYIYDDSQRDRLPDANLPAGLIRIEFSSRHAVSVCEIDPVTGFSYGVLVAQGMPDHSIKVLDFFPSGYDDGLPIQTDYCNHWEKRLITLYRFFCPYNVPAHLQGCQFMPDYRI